MILPQTNNDIINIQHNHLYELANNVIDENSLSQFLTYTIEHFQYEENFPNITKEHKEDHINLLEDINFLINTRAIKDLKLTDYLKEVLIEHIKNHDIYL